MTRGEKLELTSKLDHAFAHCECDVHCVSCIYSFLDGLVDRLWCIEYVATVTHASGVADRMSINR